MSTLEQQVEALESLYERALAKGKKRFVGDSGRADGKKLNQEQLAAHGLAYLATETQAARQLLEWAGANVDPGGARPPARSAGRGRPLGPAGRLFGHPRSLRLREEHADAHHRIYGPADIGGHFSR